MSRDLPTLRNLAFVLAVVSACGADPVAELRADIPLPEGYVATELAQLDRTRFPTAADVTAVARSEMPTVVGRAPQVRLLLVRQLPRAAEPTWIVFSDDVPPPPIWGDQARQPLQAIGPALAWVFLRLDGSIIGTSTETPIGR